MEELNELKNLVIQTLEANGCLSNIRAQIRSSVFKVVDEPGTEKKVQSNHNADVAIPLGEREVPGPAWQGERQGAAHAGEGVLPVLQHGLLELRVRLGGQLPRRGQARGPCPQAGHRGGPGQASANDCNRKSKRMK